MTLLELIDRLCKVVEEQAGIIREQTFFIENCKTIDEETKKKFADMRGPASEELDIIELHLRPFHNTGCGKEDDYD